jgi:ElaB/YqjD/DUF883 family membrane-anchored ribosome-binding protein
MQAIDDYKAALAEAHEAAQTFLDEAAAAVSLSIKENAALERAHDELHAVIRAELDELQTTLIQARAKVAQATEFLATHTDDHVRARAFRANLGINEAQLTNLESYEKALLALL